MPLPWLPRASTCPGTPETRPLAGCPPPTPGLLLGELDVAVPPWLIQRQLSMQGGPSQVCVRACACAALTCRLLTEVFVCTQASELRGPPALPPLPSEPRPCLRHLSDLAVFHCLLPTDPAGLPAWTLFQPPHPSLPFPAQHPGIAMGPYGPSLPKWTFGWAGQEPPHGLSTRKGWPSGVSRPPPQAFPAGKHPASACASYRCCRPCLSIRLSVCVSVTVREGGLQAGMG